MPTATRIMRILDCKDCSEYFIEHRKFLFYFVVIWNLFEQKKMNRNASIFRVNSFVNSIGNINNINIDEIFIYFKNRYTENNQTTELFNNLLWRPEENDIKTKTIKTLFDTARLNKKNQIKAVLSIIFRLRNNLFHGVKDIASIDEQRQTFELVNSFMLDLLEL